MFDPTYKFKYKQIEEKKALKAFYEGNTIVIGIQFDGCPGFVNAPIYQSIQNAVFDRHGNLHSVMLDVNGIEIFRSQIENWFIQTLVSEENTLEYRMIAKTANG